jgi:GrpB-like predicted nucleotidyltransferase (UPF0157 family)
MDFLGRGISSLGKLKIHTGFMSKIGYIFMTMLGLKRNTVEVIPYQARWVDLYRQAEMELRRHLQGFIIDMAPVGSTAIVGLPAKPIIDIAITIESYDQLVGIRQVLIPHDYEDRGEMPGGYMFGKREKELITHHLHFVLPADKRWRHYIAFRDRLNADTRLRDEYLELKKKLAERYPHDRPKYTAAKDAFIKKVLRQIEEEKSQG